METNLKQINKRIERVYEYIEECLRIRRISPTQREIAKACSLSVSTVGDYLSRLEAQGRIARTPLISRSIRLTNNTPQSDETAEEVLAFICKTITDNDIVPTQREIASGCYLSRSEVRRALLWLEGQGKILRGEGQRNIKVFDLCD
jgi:DNA-binding GntR family transcriptional regulator